MPYYDTGTNNTNLMNKVICLAFLICFSTSITYGQNSPANVDSLVNNLGANFIKNKQAVGLSIGVYINGKACFYNFGTTEIGTSQLPTKHTVYEIGSITKTFVSFILANAVLEQKVSLDDDVRKYLKGSYPNLEYRGHPIQLIHLANTTSLLPDWLPELPAAYKTMSADSALTLKIKRYGKLTKKDFFTALHTVKLDTVPGTRRYHSNAGAQLLAYILEGVYKMPLEKLINKYITAPYKLNNTAFINSNNLNKAATGYTASNKKAVYESIMPYFQYAGGLGSTSNDMVNYIKLLLDTTNQATALSLKKTIDINASTGKVTTMRPDNMATPDIYSVSLNWFKYQPTVSSAQIWADGGTNGFNSYLVIYPYLKSGIILMANKSDEKIFKALPGIAYEIAKFIEPK
jgi:serine-type D-Ala-D-Ala carboxypeptidase/endopeptidase